MNPPVIVFLDAATLSRNDLDLEILNRLGRAVLHPTTTPAQTAERIRDADVVITNKAVLDSASLTQAARLRLIAVCATGTNNVDLAAARKQGIRVVNVTGYGTASVAQHALGFMLNWATQIHRYTAERQKWPVSPFFTRLDHPVRELAGRSLGLLGTGKIGSEVGRLAEALGMTVRCWARDGGPSTSQNPLRWPRLALQPLFESSDVISLHCPLTAATRHIINRQTLGWMKKGAFLVNTGRGDLVDEIALREALESGHLGGAGLDVLSVEPPPADHPLLKLDHPDLMITPHSAWTSYEARNRLLQETAANIAAFLKGEERNRVA